MTFGPTSGARPQDGTSDNRLNIEGRRLRLIVVEGDALIAMELAQTIETAGGELIGTAATADDAALLADESKADVVVIDMHLKGRGDGLHAARGICAKLSSVAVLFITGSATSEMMERVRAFNGTAPLFKPLNYRELPGVIVRAFSSRRGTATPDSSGSG